MQYIADLHTHSPYSRATSKSGTLQGLFGWARLKGIHLVGSGDFTHPAWQQQLKEQLIPAEPGFFRLRDEKVAMPLEAAPEAIDVRFTLSTEISCIYKKLGRVRKVHALILVPDFPSAERITARLAAIGNIESDGRPILGLDCRNLLEIVLSQAPGGFLVPAHIWTPWFSLFGSKSGFDSVEECFDDLAGHIFALETGLSSDPAMNRLVSALDRYALVSNSDCHSPAKLGREANRFSTGFDFFAMRAALAAPGHTGFDGTIEFYPEEGKYHFDGHRKCGVCLDPHETMASGPVCPVCGRELTIGVHHRILELADRQTPVYGGTGPNFASLVPLPELLGEIRGCGPATRAVHEDYRRLIGRFGSEFNILLQTPVEDLRAQAPLLGEAVARMRAGRVRRDPGYDGEFGTIKVFEEGELSRLRGQSSLFAMPPPARKHQAPAATPALAADMPRALPVRAAAPPRTLNAEQQAAVDSAAPTILVTAGPGTGKTHTLVSRVRQRIERKLLPPAGAAVITFTNRAAAEVGERLADALGGETAGAIFVGTFHRFCLFWLERLGRPLTVVGADGRQLLLCRLFPDKTRRQRRQLDADITAALSLAAGNGAGERAPDIDRYLAHLAGLDLIDLDAIVPVFADLLERDPEARRQVVARTAELYVDEFQDINHAQYRLVRALAGGVAVFAIGDPDQAIYGFRGSDPRFFFSFRDEFRPEEILLSRNYRSAAAIIEAAVAVIARNRRRSGLRLTAAGNETAHIEFQQAASAQAEAEHIVARIEEAMGGISHFSIDSGRGGDQDGGAGFADIAILCRLNRLLPEIHAALSRRGIPVQTVGVEAFYTEPPLLPLYLRLLSASRFADNGELATLALETLSMTTADRDRLQEAALGRGDFFTGAIAAVSPATAAGLELLSRQIEEDGRRFTGLEPAAAVGELLETLAIDPAAEDGRRLLRLAASFGGSLADFAGHLRRHRRETVYDPAAEAVALMTVHAAKGLEFPVVFVPGLEEGIFPRSTAGEEEIEEERRLFYVALTRARQRLYLSAAGRRSLYGADERREISRFVGELPAGSLQRSERKRSARPATQLSLF
ncbi:MAG: UvrD-helicase domain-containing protein [Thermodesulfobacteriota bacterium]